jgi:hypothetical protein
LVAGGGGFQDDVIEAGRIGLSRRKLEEGQNNKNQAGHATTELMYRAQSE